MDKPYSSPAVVTIGSVQDLTAFPFNKIGSTADAYTAVTGGAIVGSLVPAP